VQNPVQRSKSTIEKKGYPVETTQNSVKLKRKLGQTSKELNSETTSKNTLIELMRRKQQYWLTLQVQVKQLPQ